MDKLEGKGRVTLSLLRLRMTLSLLKVNVCVGFDRIRSPLINEYIDIYDLLPDELRVELRPQP